MLELACAAGRSCSTSERWTPLQQPWTGDWSPPRMRDLTKLNKRLPSWVKVRWRESVPAWSWSDRWRGRAQWRTLCCGPAVRDLHTEPHLYPAWFCIWQRWRLRCNANGKLDYELYGIRSTRSGFYHQCFGCADFLEQFILVEILTTISIHLPLAALQSDSTDPRQTKRRLREINIKTKSDSAEAQPTSQPV